MLALPVLVGILMLANVKKLQHFEACLLVEHQNVC